MAGGNDAWAVGDTVEGGTALVLRLEGTADWKVADEPPAKANLRALHGLESHLAWAVGENGTLYRYGTP